MLTFNHINEVHSANNYPSLVEDMDYDKHIFKDETYRIPSFIGQMITDEGKSKKLNWIKILKGIYAAPDTGYRITLATAKVIVEAYYSKQS